MAKLSRHLVLFCGILSPILALLLYALVYGVLTARSVNLEKDWLFRLCASTAAMLVPSLLTLLLAARAARNRTFGLSPRIGAILAILALGLAWKPVSDGILRYKQTRNLAMRGVAAPLFDTPDILGHPQRLADQQGKVVLVNIWATWCGPCRAEMPELEQLYQSRKGQGFMIFGISDEDIPTQQKFLKQIPVSYPLLTLAGNVPHLYRDIARYPAVFLIDRQGRLQPAPPPGQPFEKMQAAVDTLLHGGS